LTLKRLLARIDSKQVNSQGKKGIQMKFSPPATAMLMVILAFAPPRAASAQTTNAVSPQESSAAKGTFKITEVTVIPMTHQYEYGTGGIKYVGLFQNPDGQQRKLQFVLYPMGGGQENITVAADFDQSPLCDGSRPLLCIRALPCAVFQSDWSTNSSTQHATEALRQGSERQQAREAVLKFQEWATIAQREHVTSVSKPISNLTDQQMGRGIWFYVDAAGGINLGCAGGGYSAKGDSLDAQFCLYLLDSDELESAANRVADSQRKEIAKRNLFK
jgi:hypothetical protein